MARLIRVMMAVNENTGNTFKIKVIVFQTAMTALFLTFMVMYQTNIKVYSLRIK